MGMIERLERIEQRMPNRVRAAVWGSLRVPHRVVRRRVVAAYLATHPVRKLQIGCGGNLLSGWLNSDLNPVRSLGIYLATHREGWRSESVSESLMAGRQGDGRTLKDIIFLDATKTLPFADGTFDCVFSEHMIEHIAYHDAMCLINEVYRILKPGGRVRISTPDLRFLVDLYEQDKSAVQRRYIAWATETFLPDKALQDEPAEADRLDTFVINNFVRSWGHQFIYDQKTLEHALERSGFCATTRYQPGESDDERMRGIESHGWRISDDFNRLESIVIEASKPVRAPGEPTGGSLGGGTRAEAAVLTPGSHVAS
jgi:predicted SAM-dependent methyltransferase